MESTYTVVIEWRLWKILIIMCRIRHCCLVLVFLWMRIWNIFFEKNMTRSDYHQGISISCSLNRGLFKGGLVYCVSNKPKYNPDATGHRNETKFQIEVHRPNEHYWMHWIFTDWRLLGEARVPRAPMSTTALTEIKISPNWEGIFQECAALNPATFAMHTSVMGQLHRNTHW